jgi:hypothetical protein
MEDKRINNRLLMSQLSPINPDKPPNLFHSNFQKIFSKEIQMATSLPTLVPSAQSFAL